MKANPTFFAPQTCMDLTTCNITGIVDWQGATVASIILPFMCQTNVQTGWTRFVLAGPENIDRHSEDGKKKLDEDLEKETLHKGYEAMANKPAPCHWAVLKQLKDVQLKRNPAWLVTGVWEN